MREKKRIKAKITFLLTALAIGWPIGFILGAAGYYATGMKTARMALQFMNFTGLAALVLALLCGIPFMMMTEARIRDGQMPIDIYRKEYNNFLCFMPPIAGIQLMVCAFIVGVRFLFAAGGIAVLMGTIESEMDLLAGSLLCGLLCGFAVVNMAHFMVMMKASVMDSENRERNGVGRKKHSPEEEENRVQRAPRKAEPVEEMAPAEEEHEEAETPESRMNLPAFQIPRVSRSEKKETLRAPQPRRRMEKETPTEDFDLPKEEVRYPADAYTRMLPDVDAMGLEFVDVEGDDE